jgi:transcriptional regulator with XRE-family HTH domain
MDLTEAQGAVGAALARMREAAGLDPVTFCDLAGYDAEILARIESGKYNSITVRVLCTYAEVAGISIEDLIARIVEPFDDLAAILKKSRKEKKA